MPLITIIHVDDRFKVLRNGEQIRVPMSTGKTLPVEFESLAAASNHAEHLGVEDRLDTIYKKLVTVLG